MSSLADMLAVFDVAEVGAHQYVGHHDAGDRAVIDGSQVLAQSIVAATKSVPGKVVRSAHAIFGSAIAADAPIELSVEVVRDGRTVATARVVGRQGDRVKTDALVLLDVPQPDVVRRSAALPATAGAPDDAIPRAMPLEGRELRLVGVVDENDPAFVGPPVLDAWLRYDLPPTRDDLVRALLAHFTGHLSISTTMFPHAGLGTAQSHVTVSTAPMTITVAFHEPVLVSNDWLLYHHESTQVGAGMSYVRGQIFRATGDLVASFTQEAMIRAVDAPAAGIAERARL